MEEMIKRHRYLLNESLKGKEKEYNLRYLLSKKNLKESKNEQI